MAFERPECSVDLLRFVPLLVVVEPALDILRAIFEQPVEELCELVGCDSDRERASLSPTLASVRAAEGSLAVGEGLRRDAEGVGDAARTALRDALSLAAGDEVLWRKRGPGGEGFLRW